MALKIEKRLFESKLRRINYPMLRIFFKYFFSDDANRFKNV